MITLSPEYAAHFHDIHTDGKDGAKMTGDRMKMLMLTLPSESDVKSSQYRRGIMRNLMAVLLALCSATGGLQPSGQ